MNNNPSKLDIVSFVEDVLELKLLDYQKQFVSMLYEAYKKDELNNPDLCLYARGGGSRYLYAMCLIIFGYLKDKKREDNE